MQGSPKIACLQEAQTKKASKLQNVQWISYRMCSGLFMWHRNSSEDQNNIVWAESV